MVKGSSFSSKGLMLMGILRSFARSLGKVLLTPFFMLISSKPRPRGRSEM